ncbi:MAG TPA: ribonuclease P protein component 1 [Candidatus Diapherotrites archaeon]|uniref:Ribonuclease P protein component 1 n=1 Tax=Candidatus Iainarchaeum sp. TaxID=3101447 RepID=A0A7J4JIU0_9ARCH|nr:ribonuclease P protein component 1 [Candidatus Diapherotrites archaeon]HIH16529.1 ribonuclease P protein component 1 [Candidatus Diapherotrites archaeon]
MIKTGHYCISAENLLGHELIGLEARVLASSDRGRAGFGGRIVDETRNVLVLESRGREKRVPKNEALFLVEVGGEAVEVDGKRLVARPEDRVKLFFRKKEFRKKEFREKGMG